MKKTGAILLAAMLALSMSMSTFAAAPDADPGVMFDEDGEYIDTITIAGNNILLDGILPGETFYISLGEHGEFWTTDDAAAVADAEFMTDSDYFKYKLKKDTNSSMVSSITVVTEKKFDGYNRANYLKVVLKDNTSTEEAKTTGTITFTAKKDASEYTEVPAANTWDSSDVVTFTYTFWITNEKVEGSDGDAETGDRVYFSPEENEDNVFIWGDDRASLEFTSDDSADSFYARLSTKNDSSIWTEYADPIGADLWFYDFVGNPTIPSTSRAALTLGIPWDENDDYAPDPEDCYIYQIIDGELVDVTSSFAYSTDDWEIEGWTVKTRTLGTYVISDMELDVYDEVELDDTVEVDSIPETGGAADAEDLTGSKPVANTGR